MLYGFFQAPLATALWQPVGSSSVTMGKALGPIDSERGTGSRVLSNSRKIAVSRQF